MTDGKHGRAHWFLPEELGDEQREYYEGLLDTPRRLSTLIDDKGRLQGPFNARLLDPPVGTAIQGVGTALRFGGHLSNREREIVILETARSERCDFEWVAHSDVAREVGVTDEQMDSIFTGLFDASFTPEERLIRRLAHTLITDQDIEDGLFAEAETVLGPSKIFDVVSLVGHYRHTALALRVWRVPLREGMKPVF